MTLIFSVSYREAVRERIISRAKTDKRIVSVAVIGSYAQGNVDRWSDIDLTFGVDEQFPVSTVLNAWTDFVLEEFSGVILFDVKRGSTIYRVFILPGCLQLDLSFSPASEFGATGPNFTMLYGQHYEKPKSKPQSTEEIFGWMIHHILRARFCVERYKLWQAEFWISEARNYALKLGCISRGLNPDYGRSFDELPENILSSFRDSFVTDISKDEILRVINSIIAAIPNISDEVNQLRKKVSNTLNELSLWHCEKTEY